MIHSLDMTLKKLLKRELSEDLSHLSIVFNAPNKEFKLSTGEQKLNLFLYDIRENRELRTNEPVWERKNGTMETRRPPVRVACSYLITAWIKEGDDCKSGTITEHHILSEVMIALLRYPRIPQELLQGKLANPPQPVPLPVASLQPGNLQSIGEFWQAMSEHAPKAVLHYTVTISVDPFEPVEVPLVTEQVTKLRLEQRTAP
jgi:hypothetical protein